MKQFAIDGLAEALGRVVAEKSKEFDRLLAVRDAEAKAVIADLRLQVRDLQALVHEKLASVKDGEKGAVGEKGDAGPPGPQGEKGDQGASGDPGPRGEDGATGPVGPEGPQGKDAMLTVDMVQEALEAYPDIVRSAVAEWLFEHPPAPGKDGEKGPMGPPGMHGKDGAPGRDGLPGVAGPSGRDGKDGAAGINGKDGASFDLQTIEHDGDRTVIFKCPAGTFPVKFPIVIFQDRWQEGKQYERGDEVTFGGQVFRALKDTDSKPGPTSIDWRVAAARGRDGRDGKDGAPGPIGPEGRPGRDLTQLGPDGRKW